MSSLLEQAIVDAKALKEAAMKNAEATIIDKYSEEVKSTLNQLLEQDELEAALGLGGGDEGGLDLGVEAPSSDAETAMQEEVEKDEIAEGVPDSFTEDVDELDGVKEGDLSEVTIDFAELAEALKELRESVEEEETIKEAEEEEAEKEAIEENEIELDEESIVEMVEAMLSDPTDKEDETLEEAEEEDEVMEEGEEEESLYEELSDGLLDAIMEKLTVDMGATLSGWAGRSSEDKKHQMELEMAHRRSTEVAEELEALKKAQEELVFENKRLKQNLSNYQEVVNSLKENVQDVNLSNARLLYTNRTLRNTSLNERQKERIVEAISKAGSVEEAKTIHETLQSTVSSTPKRGPKTLSEAINRPTSVIRASRKKEPKVDPFTARMRKLAGIN
jgi:FtsZ-binding cell division protein ZapB